jgi:thiamine pyrophosphokinase
MQRQEIVVVAAGPGPSQVTGLPQGALVIAADGGLERCAALGLRADVVVGDLDSAEPGSLAAAQERGAEIQRHPTRKDATDLELALDEALVRGARRILVVASAEGRLDHLLSSLLLLGHERYAGVELEALVGEAHVVVVRGERRLAGAPGATLTLLALHGPAEGVRTEGLDYPLRGERLDPGSSRGVSNVFSAPFATISLERGVLLAILPGADE